MKKFLFAALMLALMGSAAFATDTRLETMGMGSFWYNGTYVPALNSVIKDDANISMYPSTINYYPNIFWGEIDSHEDYSSKSIYGDKDYFYKAGALFQLGDEEDPCVLGMHFSTVPYENTFNYNLYNYDSDDETNHRMNLYYGRKLSDMAFGFTFGYYHSSQINENVFTYTEEWETEDSVYTTNNSFDQYENSFTRYEFGFGLSPMEGKLDLALNLALTSWTNQDYRYIGNREPDSTTNSNDSGLVDITSCQ